MKKEKTKKREKGEVPATEAQKKKSKKKKSQKKKKKKKVFEKLASVSFSLRINVFCLHLCSQMCFLLG